VTTREQQNAKRCYSETAAAYIDTATDLYVSLTSSTTPIAAPPTMSRLKSFPQAFPYKLPASDNIYQNEGISFSGTVAPAVGDGYYSFIPGTLPPGQYQLKFGGKVPTRGTSLHTGYNLQYRNTLHTVRCSELASIVTAR
jgi:hypothetical protein